MRPEDVQAVVVSKRKKITDLNYTISWNGSWPSSTVFVVMSRQQKKLTSLDAEWAEIKQVCSHCRYSSFFVHNYYKVNSLLMQRLRVTIIGKISGSSLFTGPLERNFFIKSRKI